MFRILHVGLGPLGRMVAADLHERGLGEIVAAVDTSSEISGKKLSDLVPQARAKVGILASLDALGDWKSIDCAIVTTSSDLERCAPTFRELLMRGFAVVSTCEELCWPWLRHEALARELDLLARENRGRLLGTGVNPGFLMDAFPLLATAVSKSVRSLRVIRRQDASIRRVPFQKKIGAGLFEEQFEKEVSAGSIRHVGLPESLHFLAHGLGFPLSRWEESLFPVVAERDLEFALGRIPKGRVSGVRQEARGFSRVEESTPFLQLEFVAAIGLADPHDRVIVDGDPPIDLTWKGGVPGDVATSAIVLNSIAPLLAAPPGLHTMSTISMFGCARPPAATAPARKFAEPARAAPGA